MIVDSHNIEFGYELLSAVPYAYELYLQGKLEKSISGKLSEPLYYFSPNHVINTERRSWYNTKKARESGLPYTDIHKYESESKVFPPYAEHFKNDVYKYDKPTLCICNRINLEWDTAAINYFDEEILDWLFENLKTQFEIIYFPVDIPESIRDQVDPYQLNDKEVAKKHGVKLFTDILDGRGWNEAMLMLFANCERYITMNGGYSIMASMFPGQNIIYSKPGRVQTKEIIYGSFWRWYPNHANQQTLHVPDYDSLKKKVTALYIKSIPTANVLIRTHKRPNYFSRCISSVLKQDYENVNIVVICDEEMGVKYSRGYKCRMIQPDPVPNRPKPAGDEYTSYFPYNEYIDQVQRKVNGYLFFLDDDDQFARPDAISIVMKHAKRDSLMVWRVNMKKYGIIPNKSFGKEPVRTDITGIGMCYHTDNISKSDWSQWKCADYRTAKGFDKIVWIDCVLSEIQDEPGRGIKTDLDFTTEKIKKMSKKEKVLVTFVRDFNTNKKGDTVWVDWIVATNLAYRKMITICEDAKREEQVIPDVNVIETEVNINDSASVKEEKEIIQDKELNPEYETKDAIQPKKRITRKK